MTRSAEAQQLSLGVLARSRKPNELRLPIHPAHFSRIDSRIRPRIFLEHGYGSDFGATDDALAELVGGIGTREQLIADCDVILLPKVQAEDLAELNVGQVVWGWPHCVQDAALTQIAIDRRLTMIAFEAMNHWQADGGFGLHVFHKNNELAGYCSVLHAMQLAGITGSYGRRLRAAVIGFGATARGAVTALNAHGVDDVRVLTNREVAAVGSPIPSTQIVQMGQRRGRTRADMGGYAGRTVSSRWPSFLADNDIVVNCVLQDPGRAAGLPHRRRSGLFHTGQPYRRRVVRRGDGVQLGAAHLVHRAHHRDGNGVHYYAVDHSPSYLWNSATWEISEALLPHIETVLAGPAAWNETPTISRAIEIRDGVVLNPGILSFQHRDDAYPHAVRHDCTEPAGAVLSRSTPAHRLSPWEGRRRQPP